MGIYIFDWPVLREYFMNDQDRELMDFGHDVIPAYLANKESVYAYSFTGYWKDVGTVESLWDANMEFIDPVHELNIRDKDWVIYTRIPTTLPQRISREAVIENSILADGVVIQGTVNHSVVSYNSIIEKNVVVKDSVIMPGATIEEGAHIENVIVGENAIVKAGTRIIEEKDTIKVLGYEEELGGEV
jgi:glucose-1-phosphate adenylyltransferase